MNSITLSKTDLRDAKEEKLRRMAYQDFTVYKRLLFKRYIQARHLEVLDWHLTEVERYFRTKGREGIQNLIVAMPRRYSKTLTVGQLFSSWFLGRHHEAQVMMTSYGSPLVEKTSRKARNLVASPAYQHIFDIELDQTSRSASDWSLANREGGMHAVGVMGGATGFGWSLAIFDDLIKNREEAESELMRDKTWDELQDSFFNGADYTYAVRVIVGTRWHPDGPIGRILKSERNKWVYLQMPAISLENDKIGRGVGESLWDYKHTIQQLRELEEHMSPYSWSSLWQQEPVPASGGFFQRSWFHITDNIPEIVYKVRYWDLAFSEKTTADFTVGLLLGQGTDGHYYILDVVRRRVDFGELVEFIAQVMIADGHEISQGIEDAFMQYRVVQDLNADPRLHGHSVMGQRVDKAKHIRAMAVQGRFQSNQIHLVLAHWNNTYIDEMTTFSIKTKSNVHDDQVDATSGAWAMMDNAVTSEGWTSW